MRKQRMIRKRDKGTFSIAGGMKGGREGGREGGSTYPEFDRLVHAAGGHEAGGEGGEGEGGAGLGVGLQLPQGSRRGAEEGGREGRKEEG